MFTHFQLITVLWAKNSIEKHLYNQSGHYGKYGMFDRQSVHHSYGWVCRFHDVRIITHFATSSSNTWLTFQAKNNVRSVPASSTLT